MEREASCVVCFGDSITHGFGVPEERSFPAILSRRLNVRVINAGVDGDTAEEALNRLEPDVLRFKPGLVTIEFGANDYLAGARANWVRQNLELIATRVRTAGAEPIILSLGEGFWGSEFESAARQAARNTRSGFLTGLLEGIIDNPMMTLDGVHPNVTGYIVIARRVAGFLRPGEEEHGS